MSEKIQIAIYRLKKSIIQVNKKEPTIVDLNFVKKMLVNTHKYKAQRTNDIAENFEINLYYKVFPSETPWKGFIKEIAVEGENITDKIKIQRESFVLILRNKKIPNNIYAIAGGFGYTTIQDVIDNNFGIDILSRLITEDDKMLRSSKERSITGGLLGTVKFFRKDYNLHENDSFGAFYQELLAGLDKNTMKEAFGFSDIEQTYSCIAKNSFLIKKSISISEAIALIEKCELLLESIEPKVEINSIIRIGSKEKERRKKLESELDNHLYDMYIKKCPSDIDICHYDFDKYRQAERFRLTSMSKNKEFDSQISFQDILDFISEATTNLDKDKFVKLLNSCTIESFDSDGIQLTSDTLRKHFNTEIEHKKIFYFLMNNEWYEIKPKYIEKLNKQCQSFIDNNKSTLSLKDWSASQSEGTYNESHIGDDKTIVLDRVLIKNIEVCDVLKWDDNNVYFIHVKEGFGQTTRDLCSQISIAARLIQEDKLGDKSQLKALHDKVLNGDTSSAYRVKVKEQFSNITCDDFCNLLSKRIVFVFAIKDISNKSIDKIEDFNSNIAKSSLQDLIKEMNSVGVELQIAQITAN